MDSFVDSKINNSKTEIYNEYIKNQKENADIIIKYYEVLNNIQCEMIIIIDINLNKLSLIKNITSNISIENKYIKFLFKENIFENIKNVINIILM